MFSKVPYDILWKYDEDELPGLSENVKLSKWLPQSDLLSKSSCHNSSDSLLYCNRLPGRPPFDTISELSSSNLIGRQLSHACHSVTINNNNN